MLAQRWTVVDVLRFVLRLPPDLHEELKAWAEEEERSLHAQIIYVLRRALKEWRRKS